MTMLKRSITVVTIAVVVLFLCAKFVPVSVKLVPAKTTPLAAEHPLCIEMKGPGDYYIGARKTSLDKVVDDLKAEKMARKLREDRVLIWADQSIPYEEFIQLANALKAKEVYKIGLIRSDSGCDLSSKENNLAP